MSRCEHAHTVDVSERCYTGSVAGGDENRAAHGGICVEVECSRCGARRSENRNGGHIECGPWGPSRSQRNGKGETNV